jgi:hypothetical protein
VAINLPAGAAKQVFIIVDGKGDAGTNNITITPNGAETIKGAASLVLSSNYTGVVLVFTGTNWDTFGPFIAPGQVTPADFVGILPVSKGGTGISSFGAGVATWLGTPSSANLASAVTDETGTGALVFANSPTLVTPALGTPSAIVLTSGTGLPIDGGTINTLPINRGGTGQITATLAFNALSPLTTKGDLVSNDGTDDVRVAVGANGTVLTANSAQASGLTWTSPLTNPMTTQGDIIYGDTGGAAVRLAAGTSGQVLRTNGVAAPTWSAVGLLPLGSVIATFPHLTGAYSTVATTNPDTNGFVLCQGQTLASGAMSGQVVPNINNNAFLRGNSTSSNTISGASSVTLAAANIPSLTSSGTSGAGSSHSHGASGLSNSTSSISGTALGAGGHSHTIQTRTNSAGGFFISNTGDPGINPSSNSTDGVGDHTHSLSGTAAAQTISGNTAAEASHTHSVTVNYTNGSLTSFSILPTYINAVYLMRAN